MRLMAQLDVDIGLLYTGIILRNATEGIPYVSSQDLILQYLY